MTGYCDSNWKEQKRVWRVAGKICAFGPTISPQTKSKTESRSRENTYIRNARTKTILYAFSFFKVPAKQFYPALPTLRIPCHTNIPAMKNKPVMRNGNFILRDVFHQL